MMSLQGTLKQLRLNASRAKHGGCSVRLESWSFFNPAAPNEFTVVVSRHLTQDAAQHVAGGHLQPLEGESQFKMAGLTRSCPFVGRRLDAVYYFLLDQRIAGTGMLRIADDDETCVELSLRTFLLLLFDSPCAVVRFVNIPRLEQHLYKPRSLMLKSEKVQSRMQKAL